METNIKALIDRVRLADFDSNKNKKYRQYAAGQEFYSKVGNKMDEMMRVSYFLIKFLSSTPPKLPKSAPQSSSDLVDYDDLENEKNVSAAKGWDYEHEGYTLFSLDKLPVNVESEFDFNFVMFHSFISLIKPAAFFIHKHEMIWPSQKESRKENVTRVFMNLTQLFIFARSIDPSNVKDIMSVIQALFYGFPDFFTIAKDSATTDPEGDAEMDSQDMPVTQTFFEAFSQQSALFFIFLLAYDDNYTTAAELKADIAFFLSTSPTARSTDFMSALNNHTVIIDPQAAPDNITEYRKKLREHVSVFEVRSQLLGVAMMLATKILKEAGDLSTLDLEKTFLDMNYTKIFQEIQESHATEIKDLRFIVEKEVREIEEKEKSNLRAELSAAQQNEKLQLEKAQLQEQENKVLRTENLRLKEELREAQNMSNTHSIGKFNYEQFERMFPEVFAEVKVKAFRVASKKAETRLHQLESEINSLRSASTQHTENHSNGYSGSTAREPDHVEEPEFYDQQSVVNFEAQGGYYNNVRNSSSYGYGDNRSYRPHPQQRSQAPYGNNVGPYNY